MIRDKPFAFEVTPPCPVGSAAATAAAASAAAAGPPADGNGAAQQQFPAPEHLNKVCVSLFASALRSALQAAGPGHPCAGFPVVVVSKEAELRKFRKATSLHNGVQAFVAIVDDFEKSVFHVAPMPISLEDDEATNFVCPPWRGAKPASPAADSERGNVERHGETRRSKACALTAYIMDFFDPYRRAALPKARHGAVRPKKDACASAPHLQTAVLSSFHELVVQDDRSDVLVLFHTTACPACPSTIEFVDRIFEEIELETRKEDGSTSDGEGSPGATLSPTASVASALTHSSSNLHRVRKLKCYLYNLETNDSVSPYMDDLDGVPKLRLFPATKKRLPVSFAGDRTPSNVMEWLADNVTVEENPESAPKMCRVRATLCDFAKQFVCEVGAGGCCVLKKRQRAACEFEDAAKV